MVLSDYIDHSPKGPDLFTNLIVVNPNQIKNFQTAQKSNAKETFSSAQKSKQASDNPESLRHYSEH
jgi:hypothetical protein